MKVLAINGSYREDGLTDQILDSAEDLLEARGVSVSTVALRELDIEFCHNCRSCMQEEGNAPGVCIIRDDMNTIVEQIEEADAYILAAPTNFGSATAIFKQFYERLAPYGYWPEGFPYPVFRKAKERTRKKAVVISSCAAPGFLGRHLFSSARQLRAAAGTIGAKPVGSVFVGYADKVYRDGLPRRLQTKLERATRRLVANDALPPGGLRGSQAVPQ